MQEVETRAGKMAYRSAGTGYPIVLLHGIPTNSFLWGEVMAHLGDAFALYAPDLIGYGASAKPEDKDLSVAAQASYLVDFMDALNLSRAHLVGHDIGGGVVQVLAARNPEKVDRIVLVDTIAYDSWPEPGIARLKEPVWDEIMEDLDLSKGFRKAFEAGMVRDLESDELDHYLAPFQDREGRMAYLRAARALNGHDLLDLAEEIDSIRRPVLILWGGRDRFQNISYGERLAAALPDAHLVVIEEGGHFLPVDRPREVAQHIRRFLDTE